jgi:S-adenosyl methyltransferase
VPDDWLRKATRPVRTTRVDATAPNVARVWNYLVGGQPVAIVMIGVLNFIEGPGLVAPGIVEVHQWRPDQGDPSYPPGMPLYGAVGRKS